MTLRLLLPPLLFGLALRLVGPVLNEDLLLAFASSLFFLLLASAAGPVLDRLLAGLVGELHGGLGRLRGRRLAALIAVVGYGRRLASLGRLVRRWTPLLLGADRLPAAPALAGRTAAAWVSARAARLGARPPVPPAALRPAAALELALRRPLLP
jgi:hypothetical protein